MSTSRKENKGNPGGSPGRSAARTPRVQAAADLLSFGPAEPPSAAVLHELRAVRDLLGKLELRLLGTAEPPKKPTQQAQPLLDDSIVDQRSCPAPRDLYLRLARAQKFRSNKIGKRICARWGDVREAMLGIRKAEATPLPVESRADGLHDLRHQLGLVKKV